MVIFRAVWILVIPTIIVVAACKIWHHAPRWIPVTFLLSAIIGVANSIPSFLILLHRMTAEQYGKVAVPAAIATGVTRIIFAVAILALAIKMKRMTEQSHPQVFPDPRAGQENRDV